MDFLRDDNNKKELFEFLSNTVTHHIYPEGKLVVITSEYKVKSNQNFQMPTCTHEEADTRIMVHLMHAIERGFKNFSIRTVDSDVMIILLGKFSEISDKIDDIWVTFGSGKNLANHSIRRIYNKLGEPKAKAILFFHAFTGCDTTSAFRGKAKKTAWNTWQAFPDATNVFMDLSMNPFQIMEESPNFDVVQRLVINMYSKSSPLTDVNDARMEIFCQKNQSMENLPPTKDALLQHTRRSIYQTGIWAMSFLSAPLIPAAQEFGWMMKESIMKPVWITIPEVSESCRDLVKCGCTSDCKIQPRCSCTSADLPCTKLCKCCCPK